MKYKSFFLVFFILILQGFSGENPGKYFASKNIMDSTKMKIEIWSDVMCPFCYIGKRNFENALSKSEYREKITIEWKSYQLDPSIKNGAARDYSGYLGKRKGWSASEVKSILQQVTETAAAAGLEFHFEKAIVANSFDAHRLSHLALEKGKQNELEELLFAAHFIEGKDISDAAVLNTLGVKAGLDSKEIDEVLKGKKYAKEVLKDISEAEQIGVQGVPFFVFDRKYAISGAQPAENFSQVLKQAFDEWQKENPNKKLDINNGPSCTPDGECK